MKLARLLKVNQWAKNFLIFAPTFFASVAIDWFLAFQLLLTFVSWCALSSAVYILNDLDDFEFDRKHPIKKSRIIASYATKPYHFRIVAISLLVLGLIGTLFVSKFVAIVAFSYILNNLLYNYIFKKIAFLDLFSLLLGYYLRLLAGCLVVDVELSFRLIAMVLLMASVFILTKRRSDVLLMNTGIEVRPSTQIYAKLKLEYVIPLLLILSTLLFAEYLINVKYLIADQNYLLILVFLFFVLFCWFYINNYKLQPHKDPIQNLISNKIILLLIVLAIFVFYFSTQ